MRRGILATRDELRSLAKRIATQPFDRIFDALRKRCSLILESPPITESQWQSLWSKGVRAAAVGAAKTAQGRIIDLLIAHHVEPNDAYCNRAIEELKNLASWSTWVDPCHGQLAADLCTAEAALAAAVGLDWLWEDLSNVDRMRILQAIRHKAIEPYHQAVKDNAWWRGCYHSWNPIVNCGCGIAGLALLFAPLGELIALEDRRDGLDTRDPRGMGTRREPILHIAAVGRAAGIHRAPLLHLQHGTVADIPVASGCRVEA